MLPYGDRRRSGGRRRSDLPRGRWRGLVVSGVLGALSAVAWQSLRENPGVPPAPVEQVVVPAQTLERARALRDEAEALTPTQILLDETARERWLPLAAELERTLTASDTPQALRLELKATLVALDRAGLHG